MPHFLNSMKKAREIHARKTHPLKNIDYITRTHPPLFTTHVCAATLPFSTTTTPMACAFCFFLLFPLYTPLYVLPDPPRGMFFSVCSNHMCCSELTKQTWQNNTPSAYTYSL